MHTNRIEIVRGDGLEGTDEPLLVWANWPHCQVHGQMGNTRKCNACLVANLIDHHISDYDNCCADPARFYNCTGVCFRAIQASLGGGCLRCRRFVRAGEHCPRHPEFSYDGESMEEDGDVATECLHALRLIQVIPPSLGEFALYKGEWTKVDSVPNGLRCAE